MVTKSPLPTFIVRDTLSRLSESLDTVEWALDRVPKEFTHKLPASYPTDAWTTAMNVAHMIVYEEEIANPVLDSLARGGDGVGATRVTGNRSDDKVRQTPSEDWFLSDAEALSADPMPILRDRFRTAREAGIETVRSFSDELFNARVMPLWPPEMRSAGWLASKTFQHTWEHGNALLRLALFAPRG